MPRPGSPQNISTLMSRRIVFGVTPNSRAASSTETSPLPWR